MAEEKDATSVPLSQTVREDEKGRDPEAPLKSSSAPPGSSTPRPRKEKGKGKVKDKGKGKEKLPEEEEEEKGKVERKKKGKGKANDEAKAKKKKKKKSSSSSSSGSGGFRVKRRLQLKKPWRNRIVFDEEDEGFAEVVDDGEHAVDDIGDIRDFFRGLGKNYRPK